MIALIPYGFGHTVTRKILPHYGKYEIWKINNHTYQHSKYSSLVSGLKELVSTNFTSREKEHCTPFRCMWQLQPHLRSKKRTLSGLGELGAKGKGSSAKLATMHYMLCATRLKNKAYLQQFIMTCTRCKFTILSTSGFTMDVINGLLDEILAFVLTSHPLQALSLCGQSLFLHHIT